MSTPDLIPEDMSDPVEAVTMAQRAADATSGLNRAIQAADVPRLDTDLDWDAEQRAGFDAFVLGDPLHRTMSVNEERGWWLAYARCYAQGYGSWIVDLADKHLLSGMNVTDNPHPQFSPAWEAWGSGYDEAGAL